MPTKTKQYTKTSQERLNTRIETLKRKMTKNGTLTIPLCSEIVKIADVQAEIDLKAKKNTEKRKSYRATACRLELPSHSIQDINTFMNVYKQNDKLNNACIEKMLLCRASVSQICKTACKLRYCTDKDKKSMLEGKITPKELRDKAYDQPDASQLSFEEIYAEIKDVSATKEMHLSDTADMFGFAVDSLENVVEKILSDKYLHTFDEKDDDSKAVITKCCDRLNKINKVITSLLT